MLKRCSIALAALSLAGCTMLRVDAPAAAPRPPVTAPPVSTTDRVVLEGTRALVIANNLFQGASAALVPALRAGMFTNEQLDKIEALKKRAEWLLAGGDTTLTQAKRAEAVIAIAETLYTMIRR